MKEVTITIDGVEYIARPKNEPVAAETKTGYERVGKCETYYAQDECCKAYGYIDDKDELGIDDYKAANYYNRIDLAENNIRADTLMRKLRQWQALNDEPVNWSDAETYKWYIEFNYGTVCLLSDYCNIYRDFGQIYFSSKEKAEEAIEVFKDELTWYFTEYMQRLDEPKHN